MAFISVYEVGQLVWGSMMGGFFKERKRRHLFEKEALAHMDSLFGLALRLTKNERDAEDLVQETYLKAFQHFEKYTPNTNCKAWLFKIETNTFINRYRKAQRERTYLADDLAPSPLDRVAASTPHPLEQSAEDQAELFGKLFGDEVNRALTKVPVDFRMAVLLVDVYSFAYKECAEIMDCPIGTVMSRLYRGRRILQNELVQYAVREGIIEEDPQTETEQEGSKVVPFAPRQQNTTG